MNYKKAYLELFNSVTNVIEQLKEIQIKAEKTCINLKEDSTPENHFSEKKTKQNCIEIFYINLND